MYGKGENGMRRPFSRLFAAHQTARGFPGGSHDRRRSFPVFFGIPDGYLEKENGESNNALSGEPLGVRAELAAEGYDSEHAEGRPACVWSWPRGDVREGTTRFSSFFCFL